MSVPEREVLTVPEVAELLGVSRRTVERLPLPTIKLGRLRRYLREQVMEYLKAKAR